MKTKVSQEVYSFLKSAKEYYSHHNGYTNWHDALLEDHEDTLQKT